MKNKEQLLKYIKLNAPSDLIVEDLINMEDETHTDFFINFKGFRYVGTSDGQAKEDLNGVVRVSVEHFEHWLDDISPVEFMC